MGQALYRKYRSKTLDEVVGQDHITTTLTNALHDGHISHAYLFVGPRGVGKTSVARILAHQVNDLPYDDEQSHLDIIEIDAASNRRIDEIRELREKVHNVPSSAKYKVYIIDEVHMLTREAFNALLKTLEEPPAHAIFILATTEAHKLPDTIVSRTQRYTFKPIQNPDIVSHLRNIADKEHIGISDDALNLIADHSGGSFRDSISILDQARNVSSTLELADMQRILGLAPVEAIETLLSRIRAGEINAVVTSLDELVEHGNSAPQIAKQLLECTQKHILSHSTDVADYEILLTLMRNLLVVSTMQDVFTALQLAVIEACLAEVQPNEPAQISVSPKQQAKPLKTTIAKNDNPAPPVEQTVQAVVEPAPPERKLESLESPELWPRVLAEIKKHHNTLYSIARMAKTTTTADTLLLEFAFPFHQKRVSEAKNTQIISDTIQKISGQTFTIECTLAAKTTKPPEVVTPKTPPEGLNTISNIFGGAEVLES